MRLPNLQQSMRRQIELDDNTLSWRLHKVLWRKFALILQCHFSSFEPWMLYKQHPQALVSDSIYSRHVGKCQYTVQSNQPQAIRRMSGFWLLNGPQVLFRGGVSAPQPLRRLKTKFNYKSILYASIDTKFILKDINIVFTQNVLAADVRKPVNIKRRNDTSSNDSLFAEGGILGRMVVKISQSDRSFRFVIKKKHSINFRVGENVNSFIIVDEFVHSND